MNGLCCGTQGFMKIPIHSTQADTWARGKHLIQRTLPSGLAGGWYTRIHLRIILTYLSWFGPYNSRCPGMAVAQSSVWMSIALTLAAYKIEPIIGKDGKANLPSLQYSVGIIRCLIVFVESRERATHSLEQSPTAIRVHYQTPVR